MDSSLPEPPPGLVDAAQRDVAEVLSRWPAGHEVQVEWLVGVVVAKKRLLGAAEWAVCRLADNGLLEEEEKPSAPSWQEGSNVGVGHGPYWVVRSTAELFTWWRGGAVDDLPTEGNVKSDGASEPTPDARKGSPKTRRSPGDNDKIIVAALQRHHKWDGPGTTVENAQPIVRARLASDAGVGGPAVTRYFSKVWAPDGKDSEAGYDRYKSACRSGRLARELADRSGFAVSQEERLYGEPAAPADEEAGDSVT